MMAPEDFQFTKTLCCAVENCEEHTGLALLNGYNVSFHRFPEDLQLQQIWAQKCKRSDEWNPQTSYICSLHFTQPCFVPDLEGENFEILPSSFRNLKKNAVPTLNLPTDSEDSESSTSCEDPIDAKTAKQISDIQSKSFPSRDSLAPSNLLSSASTTVQMYTRETILNGNITVITHYENLYNYLHNQSHILKIENNKLLKKIKSKKYRYKWPRDEVTKAFPVMYYSKRAYMYLRDELHYPLPEIWTFQGWTQTINMRNGLINDVLKIMKLNGDNIEDHEKLTVLMFDEIKVRSTREYDKCHDEIVGPHRQMQVVMAQGIASKWKQPIFVDFDVKMSKIILFYIIDKLEKIGFKVICCVTNCGDSVKLWNQLEITYENPTFCIPTGRRIVCIPDSHHLLKLARNWLLDTGFCLNGAEINKKPLESLITKLSSEESPCHKLKREHVTCKGPLRLNIKLAKELLSHSTATALQHYRPIEDFKLLNDTAQFIDLINNWFDLANVSHGNVKNTPFKSPYGTFLFEQDKLLNEMYNTIILMRCKGRNGMEIFQKGFLLHINGTKQLLQILKENSVKVLLTSKTNKDSLRNLFDHIYSLGDNPSPLNALHILRMIMFEKYPVISSNESNTKDNNHEEFLVAQAFKLANISLNDEGEENNMDTTSEVEFQIRNEDKNKKEMEVEAIEYLTGWVALKYRSTIPEIVDVSKNLTQQKYTIPSWINHLSYKKLIIPSDEFKIMIFRVEWLFNKFIKYQVPKGSNVVAKLTKKILSRMSVEKKFKPVIHTYIKQRIIIRMKYSNYRIQLLKQKNKSKN